MSDKNFISFIRTDGYLQLILGLCILSLSKITPIFFSTILCTSFFIYGGYKAINAYMLKKYINNFVLDIILGIILVSTGIILYICPYIDTTYIIFLFGLYFIFESISSAAYTFLSKSILYLWKLNFLTVISQFLFGFVILFMMPSIAMWFIGLIFGLNFLINGFIKIIECQSEKQIY